MSSTMLNVSHEPEMLIKAVSDLVEMFVSEVKLRKAEVHRNESLSTTAALKMVCLMRDIIRLFQISEARPSSVTIQMLCAGCPAMEVSSQQVCRLLFLIARTSDALLHSQVGTLLLMNVSRRVLSIVRDCAASNTATQTELEAHARVTLNHITDKRRVMRRGSQSTSETRATSAATVSKTEQNAGAFPLSAMGESGQAAITGASTRSNNDDNNYNDNSASDVRRPAHIRVPQQGSTQAADKDESAAAEAMPLPDDEEEGLLDDDLFDDMQEEEKADVEGMGYDALGGRAKDASSEGVSPLRYASPACAQMSNSMGNHNNYYGMNKNISSHCNEEDVSLQNSPASLPGQSFTTSTHRHAHASMRSGSESSGNSDRGRNAGRPQAAAPTSPAVVLTHTGVPSMRPSTRSCEFATPPPHLSESIIASEVPGQQTLRRAARRRPAAVTAKAHHTHHQPHNTATNTNNNSRNDNSNAHTVKHVTHVDVSSSNNIIIRSSSGNANTNKDECATGLHAGDGEPAKLRTGESANAESNEAAALVTAACCTDGTHGESRASAHTPRPLCQNTASADASASFFAYTPYSNSTYNNNTNTNNYYVNNNSTTTTVEFPVRLRRFYQDVLDGINEFRDEVESMNEELCRRVKKQLHSSDTVMTLGCSVTTRRYLLQAVKENQFLKVIILEGAPAPPEAALSLATALQNEGCAVQVLPDSSAFAVMGMCTKVLLGAESVLANGGMLGPVGSHVICIAARHFSVPVLVATTTLKMSPFYPSDKLCTRLVRVARWVAQEMPWSTYGPAEPVLPLPYAGVSVRDGGRSLTVHSPVTEYVPPELITLYATNETELTPSQIHRIVRANYSDAD